MRFWVAFFVSVLVCSVFVGLVSAQVSEREGSIRFKPKAEFSLAWNGLEYVLTVGKEVVRVLPLMSRESVIVDLPKTIVNERVNGTVHFGFSLNVSKGAVDTVGFECVGRVPEVEVVKDEFVRWWFSDLNVGVSFEDLTVLGAVENVSSSVFVRGLENKTSILVDPIVYSSPTVTVTDYTAGSPCTFDAVYDADVAGGWGVVTMQGVNQFVFNCKIVVGNGSSTTFFNDTGKQVIFGDGIVSGSWQAFMMFKNMSYGTFGVLGSSKQSYNGVHFLSNEDTYNLFMLDQDGSGVSQQLYVLSCDFLANSFCDVEGRIGFKVYNCHFGYGCGIVSYSDGADVYNCVMDKMRTTGQAHLEPYCSTTVVDGLSVAGAGRLVYLSSSYNVSLSNVKARSSNYLAGVSSYSGLAYFKDFDVDSWNFYFTGTCSGKIYRQYTFDLTVRSGVSGGLVEGANVSLSVDGAVFGSWLTDVNGVIVSQVLTYGFYNQTGGDTVYGGSDWVLSVRKAGFDDYNSSLLVTRKRDLTVALSPMVEAETVVRWRDRWDWFGAYNVFVQIPVFGWVIYFALTAMYMLGIVNTIGHGGVD